MTRNSFFWLCGLILQLIPPLAEAQAPSPPPVVYTIEIKQEIDAVAHLYLSSGLAEAYALNVEAILIHLNTYGGLVDMADSMRTAILYSPVPVYVFIDNNAASAGALISIAAKKIFMRKGANIGAATVVNQTGEAMPDKYQSYLRSMMRSTAEAHGKDTIIQGEDSLFRWVRDPLIAEAMVDERVVVPGLIDDDKVLTLTAEEAVEWGYCDGIAESVDEVITRHLGFTAYEKKSYTPSLFESFKGFLMSPFLQSILILLIIAGIYLELQTPGIGLPSALAVLAAIFYFAPLYIDGLAQNWEILVFVIGLVLIAVELFILPGFGFAGIGGMICMIAGLILSLLNNVDFNFDPVTPPDFGRATLTVLVGLGGSFILVLWLSSKIGSKGLFRNVALQTDLESSVSAPMLDNLEGQEGTAATVLRPSGKVWIAGEMYDAISESGFIEKGVPVRVVRAESAQIYVETA